MIDSTWTKATRLVLVILTSVLILQACKKEDPTFNPDGYTSAVILWTGALEVDGCGWLVYIDGKPYHPVNLEEQFQEDNLEIWIKYRSDETTFICFDSQSPMSSIFIEEILVKNKDLIVLPEDGWDNIHMDMFDMDSVYIEGDSIFIQVSYSGGCEYHQFSLYKLPPNALDPPPVEVLLEHNANGDACEAWLTEWLSFSLVPLQRRGVFQVTFLLRGPPIMSSYYGEYTYKY